MEKLSVIIPCYQVENYIEETIESLLNQTYRDFSIICLDDCSQDHTLDTLHRLSERDSRIKVYANEVNLGIIGTLNKLVELSDSEWIIRMDADDIFEPSRISKLIHKIQEKPFHIVSTSYGYIDFNSRAIPSKRGLDLCTQDKSIKYMALLNSPFPSQALFHRSVFERERFDDEFKVAEDYYFFTKVIKDEAIHVANLPEKLYQYRINPSGLTHTNALLMRQNHFEIAKRYAQHILGKGSDEMNFLEIGLKLIDLNTLNSKTIIHYLQQLFNLKADYCLKFSPDKDELKEINWYTQQYFIYLLYGLFSSSISFYKKLRIALGMSFYILKSFNLQTIKWLIKNI